MTLSEKGYILRRAVRGGGRGREVSLEATSSHEHLLGRLRPYGRLMPDEKGVGEDSDDQQRAGNAEGQREGLRPVCDVPGQRGGDKAADVAAEVLNAGDSPD